MPSLRQSRQVSTRNYTPVDPAPMQAPAMATPTPEQNRQQISPFLHSSLPVYVSGSDVLQRQFYGSSNLPQHRTLPASTKGGV